MQTRATIAGFALTGFACLASPLAATPLEDQACAALSTEREGLLSRGVKDDMAKGPEWAKANLAPERMREVARLLDIEEQLAFRCPKSPLAQPAKSLLKKSPAGDVTDKDGKDPDKEDAGAPASTPQGGAGTAKASAAQQTPAAPKKKKATSNVKPKSPDAYVPPSSNSSGGKVE